MGVPLAIAAIGIGISAFGRIKAAEAEVEALRNQSILLNKSADSILELNKLNTEFILEDVKKTQGAAATKFAQSGFATDIGALSDIAMAGNREIELRTREAEREAELRRLEAAFMRRNARATRKAGAIGAFGSVLQGIGGLRNVKSGKRIR